MLFFFSLESHLINLIANFLSDSYMYGCIFFIHALFIAVLLLASCGNGSTICDNSSEKQVVVTADKDQAFRVST